VLAVTPSLEPIRIRHFRMGSRLVTPAMILGQFLIKAVVIKYSLRLNDLEFLCLQLVSILFSTLSALIEEACLTSVVYTHVCGFYSPSLV